MIDFIHTGTYYNRAFWTPQIIRNWKTIQQSHALTHQLNIHRNAYQAAIAMKHLNYYANGALGAAKDEIYFLKHKLTKYLYTHYPCDVQLLKQTLKCHSCDGTGTYTRTNYYHDILWEDDCWHCGGTGIYRTVEIIAFTFYINGETIAWHQPRGLVDFDVYLPEIVGVYQGEKPARFIRNDNTENFLLDYLTVWEFLRQQGVLQSRIGLLRAIRTDLSRIKHVAPVLLRNWGNKAVDWLIGDRLYEQGELYWFNDDYDDELPDDDYEYNNAVPF